jgi:hypothetical protein
MIQNKIKIMQWNARSINNKIPELQNNCNVHDILLLAEMWLSCKDTFFLKSLNLIRRKELIDKVVAWQSLSVTVSNTIHEETLLTATR